MATRPPGLDAPTRRPPRAASGPQEVPRLPALTILWHPDAARVGEIARLPSLAIAGHQQSLSRLEPLFAAPGAAMSAPLADPYVSRRPIELRAVGSAIHIQRACGGPEVRVNGAPVDRAHEASRAALHDGVVLELADRVVLLLHLAVAAPSRGAAHGLVGESDAVAALRAQIAQVADVPVPVLVRGETGSGKELVARALHRASGRAGRCVAVNVAAMAPSLAASELFGHVKGAFTGAARDRAGVFVEADGGTLFLDEVGDTPAEVQSMLLRVLETGEVRPVGGDDTRRVDVRLVAATDVRLEDAVADDSFRAPLLHRLAGYQIAVPPLRARREDLGRLFLHFLRAELDAVGELARLAPDRAEPWVPAPLVARFALHPWPGNVRQLRNAVRQLVISSRGLDQARVDEACEALLAQPAAPSAETAERRAGHVGPAELVAALEAEQFRIQDTAARLGIAKSTLYNLMEQCPGLRKAKDLSAEEIVDARRAAGGDVQVMAAALRVSPRGLRLRMGELKLR